MLGSIISGVGSLIGGNSAAKAAKKENDRQYDLARNSIKYRVEDAQNAGIHPLYAMGAPTLSSSMQSTGQMGQAVADAASAVGKGMSTSYQKEMERLNLANAEADLKSKQLRNADFVKQSMDSSNISRLANTDRTMKLGNGAEVTLAKDKTLAEENERIFGEAGGIYDWVNLFESLPYGKAVEAAKLHGRNHAQPKRNAMRKWWKTFKKKRGWN